MMTDHSDELVRKVADEMNDQAWVVKIDRGAGAMTEAVELEEVVRFVLVSATATATSGPSEEQLRLADAREVVAEIGRRVEEESFGAEGLPGMLSVLEHALNGSAGCQEPDEWNEGRRRAWEKYGDFMSPGHAGSLGVVSKPADEMGCNDCGAWGDALFDFLVATPIWDYVMGGRDGTLMKIRPRMHNGRLEPMAEGVGGVLCLRCFDRRARAAGVPYLSHLVAFGGGCWMGGDYDGPIPLAAAGGSPPPSEALYRVEVQGGGSFLYDLIDVGRFLKRMAEEGDHRWVRVAAVDAQPSEGEACDGCMGTGGSPGSGPCDSCGGTGRQSPALKEGPIQVSGPKLGSSAEDPSGLGFAPAEVEHEEGSWLWTVYSEDSRDEVDIEVSATRGRRHVNVEMGGDPAELDEPRTRGLIHAVRAARAIAWPEALVGDSEIERALAEANAALDRARGREPEMASRRDYIFAERIFAGWRQRAEATEARLGEAWRMFHQIEDICHESAPVEAATGPLCSIQRIALTGTTTTAPYREEQG